jgi:hypothetical protein
MNKRILSVFGLAMLMLLLLVLPALASQPTHVEGTLAYAGAPENLEYRTVGTNCIIDVDVPYVFYGDLQGFANTHFRVVSHGKCSNPPMPFEYDENLKAFGTFDGSVDGKDGTFDFVLMAKGWSVEPGDLALVGKIVILSGTNDLANQHGVLELSYLMGDPSDTYTGQIHFDP